MSKMLFSIRSKFGIFVMIKIRCIHILVLFFFSISSTIPHNLIHLGTDYGGWFVPKNLITQKSICYCFGAGEDISFDLELIKKFGCHVYTFDPTPRARQHIEILSQALKKGIPYYPNGASNNGYIYSKNILKYLHFYPLALWDNNTTLDFWAPKNQAHISHSIVNLQNTTQSIKVPGKKLSRIMADLKHTYLDLLKIDIEGAEYRVLTNIIKENIPIKCVNVEFHLAPQFFLDFNSITLALAKNNYQQVYYKKSGNGAIAVFINSIFTL